MSSNSTLVGEGLPALEMLNFHGNGSETPASRSIFPLLLSPFIFRPLVPPLPLPPTRDRMSTRFIPLLSPPLLPRPHHFFRSLDEFSFARLSRVLFRPRKKQCSVTIFRWKQNSVSMCFLSRGTIDTYEYIHAQLGKSAILRRYRCFGISVDRKRNSISSRIMSLCLVSRANFYVESSVIKKGNLE